MKLFCIPYAGGSAVIYQRWERLLDRSIELMPVELAGRGRRIGETLYDTVEDAVNDVYGYILKQANGKPYAIFGHSMGAMITYYLLKKIRKEQVQAPACVFFSGRGAPHVVRHDKLKYSEMAPDRFREEVIRLGGTSPEFFDIPELVEVFMPMLKNDFRLAENAADTLAAHAPLKQDIHVFIGEDDDLSTEQRDGWKDVTSGHCHFVYFKGGHFYINDHVADLVHQINRLIRNGRPQ
ncbi:alpha/beta fold hydrolase [Chitinophaga sp. OAE865]|uniref:thioesterase II family protein n=1 Tax=Chitinophaga sp. OAE865 TaxID=2817898 RepID=UPI001AE9B4C5